LVNIKINILIICYFICRIPYYCDT